jgi:hypothetical protein
MGKITRVELEPMTSGLEKARCIFLLLTKKATAKI